MLWVLNTLMISGGVQKGSFYCMAYSCRQQDSWVDSGTASDAEKQPASGADSKPRDWRDSPGRVKFKIQIAHHCTEDCRHFGHREC